MTTAAVTIRYPPRRSEFQLAGVRIKIRGSASESRFRNIGGSGSAGTVEEIGQFVAAGEYGGCGSAK